MRNKFLLTLFLTSVDTDTENICRRLDYGANISYHDFICHRGCLGFDFCVLVCYRSGLSNKLSFSLIRIIHVSSAKITVKTYAVNDLWANKDARVGCGLDNGFDLGLCNEVGICLLRSHSSSVGLNVSLGVNAEHGARLSSSKSMLQCLRLIISVGTQTRVEGMLNAGQAVPKYGFTRVWVTVCVIVASIVFV